MELMPIISKNDLAGIEDRFIHIMFFIEINTYIFTYAK